MTPINSALILLTYKGKALLMFQETDPTALITLPWSFIGGIAQKNALMKDSITKRVEDETGLILPSVTLVSVQMLGDIKEYFYSANLTDEDVNQIERAEGHILNFFTLLELKKLSLTTNTRHFVTQYSDLVKPISAN